MQQDLNPQSAILRQIRRSFFKYRRDHPDSHIHDDGLRELVIGALRQGHSNASVAKAAGLSHGTILNWRRQAKFVKGRKTQLPAPVLPDVGTPMPVELSVVKSRIKPESRENSSRPTPLARIYFRSGAWMECPVSAMNAEFVELLNGGGS